MAVLNSILRGQLKGKIGNQWFAHTRTKKGQPATVVGTINSSPKNPRTSAQMTQRAKFANAVKFYKHATENFFRFAFEDKRANESDYNAFMRHNIGRALLLDKSLVDSNAFPALGGNWLMSEGVLPYPSGVSFDNVGLTISGGSEKTLGSISQTLINKNGYKKGDILTMVFIATPFSENGTYYSDEPAINGPAWRILQFVLNPSDVSGVDGISVLGNDFIIEDTRFLSDNNLSVGFNGYLSECALYQAVIVTRKTKSGLKCTTSELIPNSYAQKLAKWVLAGGTLTSTNDTTTTSVEEILQSWNVGNSAILEGNLTGSSDSSSNSSDTSTGVALINDVNGKSLPFKFAYAELGGSNAVQIDGQNLDRIAVSDFVGTGCTVNSFTPNTAGTQGTLKFTVASDGNTGQIVYNPSSASGELKVLYWDSVTSSGNVDI